MHWSGIIQSDAITKHPLFIQSDATMKHPLFIQIDTTMNDSLLWTKIRVVNISSQGKNQPQLPKADNQYHIHLTLKTVLFSLFWVVTIQVLYLTSPPPTIFSNHHWKLRVFTSQGGVSWDLKVKVNVLVSQSCPTLCNPMVCSLPGSSVHGILQSRILECVAISFSRGSSQP